MKIVALVLALAGGTGAALADPAEGLWKTRPDDNGNYGHVEITACGAAVCGTLVRAFDAAGRPVDSPHVGRRIVWDMVAEGGGAYGDGRIWSPDRDKTYNARMQLSGDGLAVKGCVLGICRDGGTWTRVK